MAALFQTTFSNEFAEWKCMNFLKISLKFIHFQMHLLNENVWISLKISLKFIPKVWVNNISSLVQIMAWCLPGNKPLSEPMMDNLLMHICVTRPQWVNPFMSCFFFLFGNFRTFYITISFCDFSSLSKHWLPVKYESDAKEHNKYFRKIKNFLKGEIEWDFSDPYSCPLRCSDPHPWPLRWGRTHLSYMFDTMAADGLPTEYSISWLTIPQICFILPNAILYC